ncbi:DUF6894 family protein [Bradyrhizobium elkanii]
MDRRGTSVTSLSEACEAATCMMRSLIATVSLEDWRDWVVHVSDESGEEIDRRFAPRQRCGQCR